MPNQKAPAYYALRLELDEDAWELGQALLDSTSPMGLEVRDHSLKLPPGTPPLPPGRVQVAAYYEGREEAQDALRQIVSELPAATADLEPVQAEDWAETWKRHVKAVRVGSIWVGPPWDAEKAGDAPVKIVIEPGMAFGTGDHPTTSMCLAALEGLLKKAPGSTVLDVGTGSGVLAIAARKLGAGRVVGNDIDPIAVQIARDNAEKNGARGLELLDTPVERIEGEYDIVVANLFTNVLVQLAPRIVERAAKDAVFLLTGILAPQAAEVQAAYELEGARLVDKRTTGEWVLLELEKGE